MSVPITALYAGVYALLLSAGRALSTLRPSAQLVWRGALWRTVEP